MRTRTILGGLVMTAVAVAGCGASAGSAPPGTLTEPPGRATPMPTGTATASPVPTTDDAWDLLWVSDSMGSGGVPAAYGARIERDLGIEVRVHDAWTGGLSADLLLRTLQGQDDGILRSWGSGTVDLPQLVREAEAIVAIGNPEGTEDAEHPWEWECALQFEEDPVCVPTGFVCGPETWARYEATLTAIFDEIFRIRDGRPVVLRVFDWYLPWGPVSTWDRCDRRVECARCFGEFSAAIHRAAASRGVPVAGYLAAFNGPNGDEPAPSALTTNQDGMAVHPSEEGAAAFAEVLGDLGYEPVEPVEPAEPVESVEP